MNRSKNKLKKKLLPVLLSSSMLLSMLGTAAAAAPSDISGHWAAKQLNEWQNKSWIQGYEDGTVKPNNTVTRAEFMAFVNRAFGLTAAADVTFKDANKSGWEYAEIGKAVKAGYISGYEDGTMRSGNEISRQEAASIIAKLLNLTASDAEKSLGKFTDSQKIAFWSKHAIAALAEKSIINGYDDGSYRPSASITRAEAVVTIDRALAAKATVYDKAGTYGPESGTKTIEGDVVITAPGVTLRNVTITGNLLFAEGIGSGDAFLDGVTVKGSTTVKGGGENSVHFKNTVLITVIVNKKDGSVRIVAEGSTTVQHVTVQSSTKIEESGVTGSGFNDVDLGAELPKDSKVTLLGNFENVEILAKSIVVEVPSGSINKFGVGKDAGDSSINLGKDAKIVTLVLDAIAKILGEGKVEKATVNDGAKGSSFDKKPDTIDGPQKDSTTVNNPSTGGGGGGGSSSGGTTGTVAQSAAINADFIRTLNLYSGADVVYIDNNVAENIFTVPIGATVKVYADATGVTPIGSKVRNDTSIGYSTVIVIPGGYGESEAIYVTVTESGKSESARVRQKVAQGALAAPVVSSIVNHPTDIDPSLEFYLSNVPTGVDVLLFSENGAERLEALDSNGTTSHYRINGSFSSNDSISVAYFELHSDFSALESQRTVISIPVVTPVPATGLSVHTADDDVNNTNTIVTVGSTPASGNHFVYKTSATDPAAPNVGDILSSVLWADLPVNGSIIATNGYYVQVAEVNSTTRAVVKYGEATAVVEIEAQATVTAVTYVTYSTSANSVTDFVYGGMTGLNNNPSTAIHIPAANSGDYLIVGFSDQLSSDLSNVSIKVNGTVTNATYSVVGDTYLAIKFDIPLTVAGAVYTIEITGLRRYDDAVLSTVTFYVYQD